MFHQFHIIHARQLDEERREARPRSACVRGRSVRRWWRRIYAQALRRRPAQVRHA
jgi:hypothetical protein